MTTAPGSKSRWNKVWFERGGLRYYPLATRTEVDSLRTAWSHSHGMKILEMAGAFLASVIASISFKVGSAPISCWWGGIALIGKEKDRLDGFVVKRQELHFESTSDGGPTRVSRCNNPELRSNRATVGR